MNSFFINIPTWIEKMFPSLVWSIRTSEKEIYLTFDDGPTPEITDWVLEQLKKHKAKATFFCIGKNISNFPTIFKNIINEGHSIGNHTNNHLNGWKENPKTYLDNILKSENILNAYKLPNKTKLFRPPYGKIKPSQIQKLKRKNYKIIMWNILSADFDIKTTPEMCVKNVLKNTKKGAIIVFHDSIKASERLKHTLPIILETLSKKGYQFKALI
jgi:peptidoglycan/xylan/chitin deacetylase (PgdA/CDA1 family)